MTLKLLSEWDETFYALLLKSFMIEAVPYLWDSCSVAVGHKGFLGHFP